jgi:hypothetical protein
LNFYGRQTGNAYNLNLDIIHYADAKILDSIFSNSKAEHTILGYSGRHTPVQFLNQTLKYFSFITEAYQYNNSAVLLLSKVEQTSKMPLHIHRSVSLNRQDNRWEFDRKKMDNVTQQYTADSSNIYRPQYILPVSKALINNDHFLRVNIESEDVNHLNQITLVAVPETINGEPINDNYGNPIWMGLDVENDLEILGKASFAFSLPPNMPKNGQIKIYIWNRNKQTFQIDKLAIEIIQNIWNN